MTKLFRRRSKKVGSPPGSLIYTGDQLEKAAHLTLFVYDNLSCIEKSPQTIDEALSFAKPDKKIWLHVCGISDPRLIDTVGKHFKLHPLLLEDVMNPTQRSKLDDYKDHIYIATHLLHYKDGENSLLEDEQLSLIIGKNFLLTFSENGIKSLNPVKERLQKPASRMRERGPDYLAYAILDCIVDNYFITLEGFDQTLQSLEDELLNNAKPSTLNRIQKAKRELALLRKTIWPVREVINHLRRIDSPLVSETTKAYTHDVYDHTIQVIETVESFREFTSGMLDIYLSTINQKMNEIMKVLTIVATIFVPLTFISSLYGMNFEYMPELHHPLGYPLVLSMMAAVSVFMLFIFHRKKWI